MGMPDLLELLQEDGFTFVHQANSRGGQYNGPCVFEGCGGKDRLRVQPHHGSYGWFACNQCERKGSAVDYLMLKRGMPRRDALATVGWTPKEQDADTERAIVPAYAQNERPRWQPPPECWSAAAAALIHYSQQVLWSEQGNSALAYLRQRGLSDQTIKEAMLGYFPQTREGARKAWGRPVKLYQGIVIPWFIDGKVWRVTIRNERIVSGMGRYRQLAGGSNGLYRADTIREARLPVVVTEGEIDALSIHQMCGDLVSVVATGTTEGSHTPRWISTLACQNQVLLAFDAEEKGEKAATWWTARLPHARRLLPWWKDANQMLQDGADLRQWVTDALGTSGAGSVGCYLSSSPSPQTTRDTETQASLTHDPLDARDTEDKEEDIPRCHCCSRFVEHYSDHGLPFCAQHRDPYAHLSKRIPSLLRVSTAPFFFQDLQFIINHMEESA
jgi:hypothetical protein